MMDGEKGVWDRCSLVRAGSGIYRHVAGYRIWVLKVQLRPVGEEVDLVDWAWG